MLLGSKALKFISKRANYLDLYRVDDVAVGIWLIDEALDRVSMPGEVYAFHPNTANDVFVNPINHIEMRALMLGKDIVPQACNDTCMCPGSPKSSSDCWDKFSNLGYKDSVVRLY